MVELKAGVLQQILKSYTYVLLWMSISISVILFNKWLLAFSGFPYPITLTMWHMLFCSAVGFLCVRVGRFVKPHNMSAHDYLRRVMPIGAPCSAIACCCTGAGSISNYVKRKCSSVGKAGTTTPSRTCIRESWKGLVMCSVPVQSGVLTRRGPVRCQLVAVQLCVSLPVSLFHPDDQVPHAWPGLCHRCLHGHRALL